MKMKKRVIRAKIGWDLLRKVSALSPGTYRLELARPEGTLDCMLKLEPNASNLVFLFHGAVDRKRRQLPSFNRFFPNLGTAHQVSFCDPSLRQDSELRIAWYSGHEDFDSQSLIDSAIRAFCNTLKPQRTIFFGGSGGGFAALNYAHRRPQSIVVAANPQTNILAYSQRIVSAYREKCWPSLTSNDELARVICTDVSELYKKEVPNTVIYFQSLGDRHHWTRHALPFCSAFSSPKHAARFLFHSYFDGQLGHVASANVESWVRAACRAQSSEMKDILSAWHECDASSSASVSKSAKGERSAPSEVSPLDQFLSAKLRDWYATQHEAESSR